MMIDFPKSTAVHRRLPKEALYRHLIMTAALKGKFISDVESLYVENSLTQDNLNLAETSDIKEILLISIELKCQDFDGRIVEAIARQNPHKLVFLLRHGDSCQLALYYGKLYRTSWISKDEVNLKAIGFNLTEIWESLIEQIALCDERVQVTDNLSIDQRLVLQEKAVKLEKQIEKTEAAAWKEQQPKKKFELYTRLQTYKQELEEIKGGKA